MGRSILAVLAGFVVGNLASTLGHALQRVIYPPPPGFNFEDPEQVRALFEAMTAGGYALLLATYAVSCALRADGALYCWGSGHFGSLGRGSSVDIGDDELPSDASPIDLGRPVKQIAPGYTTCAILDDGLVRCWGRGFYGELGSGRTGPCRDTYSCHVRATCCIGDVPGELPPSPVVLF